MSKLKNNRLLLTAVITLSFLVFLSLAPAVFKWARGNAPSTFLSIASSDKIAISPDGKLVAYALFERSDKTVIRLRQLLNDTEITLVKLDSKIHIPGLSFNTESSFLYYIITKDNATSGEMFRVPITGGESTKVLTQADSEPVFSPDGSRFAYFLNHGEESRKGIRVVNTDGTNDKLVIPSSLTAHTISDWSPDGESLAYVSQCPEGVCVSEYMFADESRRIISTAFREILSLQWLADKSCLIISGKDRDLINSHIYKISYPNSDAIAVTTGLDNYLNLKMSADSYLAIAVKEKTQADLWVVSINNADSSKQVTNFGNLYKQVSWSQDGTIFVVSNSNGMQQILASDKNGDNFHELVFGKWSSSPFPLSDKKSFIYMSKGGVWRADINGENQKLIYPIDAYNYLLQNGVQMAQDKKWLIGNFNDKEEKAVLRKINIESGEMVSLSDKPLIVFSISTDGKQLAYVEADAQNHNRLIIRPLENGQPTRQFELPPTLKIDSLRLRWTRDGNGIAYNFNENIWLQPLTETSPKQLTSFTSQTIYDFDFSSNGSEIACLRGSTNNEVIQLRNLR